LLSGCAEGQLIRGIVSELKEAALTRDPFDIDSFAEFVLGLETATSGYRRGAHARLAGHPITDNPYHDDRGDCASNESEWRSGWGDADLHLKEMTPP
jgi:hypothetical protein